jgi:hypothetical protein
MSFNILRHCVYTSVEKNLNFHITKNIFVAVNAKELNNILRINGYTKIDKDNKIDELQFNKEEDDGHNDDKIEEEDDFG